MDKGIESILLHKNCSRKMQKSGYRDFFYQSSFPTHHYHDDNLIINDIESPHEESNSPETVFSNEEEDEQSLSILTTLFPKRKRKSRSKPFLRILKSDIRRSYAQMMFNVLNSHDLSLMTSFFEKYCLHNAVMEKLVTKECFDIESRNLYPIQQGNLIDNLSKNPKIPLTIQGPSMIAKYWYFLQSVVPDEVVRLLDVKIVRMLRNEQDPVTGKVRQVRDSDHTKIVCQWVAHATQVYEVSPPLFAFRQVMIMQNEIAAATEYNSTNKYTLNHHSREDDDSSSSSSIDSSSVSSDMLTKSLDERDEEEVLRHAKKPRLSTLVHTCAPPSMNDKMMSYLQLRRRSQLVPFTIYGRLEIELDGNFHVKRLLFDAVNADIDVPVAA